MAAGDDGRMDYEASLIEAGHRPTAVGPHDDDPAQQWTEVYWLLS